MARRIESPSSINTYKQCPRKYYYIYIQKLKTLPNIHCVRGNIVHSVLEDFFDVDMKEVTDENYQKILKMKIQELLLHRWMKKKDEIKKFGLTQEQEMFYFEESMMMVLNWLGKMFDKFKKSKKDFKIFWEEFKPQREQEYISAERSVRGFIDAIEDIKKEVRLMDYKTSKKFEINSDYKLQLAIYALLYEEKHGKKPDKVGIYFLKDRGKHEHILEVDEELIKWAKEEIEIMHFNTKSDDINDYPCKKGPLCKWSTGGCDFYKSCF